MLCTNNPGLLLDEPRVLGEPLALLPSAAGGLEPARGAQTLGMPFTAG